MTKKIGKGQPITELVKGSLEYTQSEISDDFREQFGTPNSYGDMDCNNYIVDTFADYVVVSEWDGDLAPDEYYRVPYTFDSGTSEYTFAPRDQWEVVELTYQPQSKPEPDDMPGANGMMGESKKKRGKRFEETVTNSVQLLESTENDKPDGPWRIKAIGITADVINGNNRRYPAIVLERAIKELRGHLHESAGQGRMLSLTGEADHPADKANRRPLLKEVVFNWDKVDFDGKNVLLEGNLLGTQLGKDIHAQMLGGVFPGISQRGYGESKSVKVNGESIDEVTQLIITGYDATAPNEQSDPNGSINFFESKQGDDEMLEELKKLLAEHPEFFGKGMNESQLEAMGEKQLKKLEESLRSKLGIGPDADLNKALTESVDKARKFDELQRKTSVDEAITEVTKNLPYSKEMNDKFTEAVRAANPQDAAAVKAIVEAKMKEYDALASVLKLDKMGFKKGSGLQVIGSVLESETGTPEFARGAFRLTESINRYERKAFKDLRKPTTVNDIFAAQYLEAFDKKYQAQLLAESRQLEEAELTTDLNLPYSVSRSIIMQVWPNLVATGLFDVAMTDQAPTRIYFEKWAEETGMSGSIAASEAVTIVALDTFYPLANARITPGSVVVKDAAEAVTYAEGTDYVVDYAGGRIMALTGGGIAALDVIHLTAYDYTAIRKGEMAPIERGKLQLSYKTLEIAADRLADQISRETILFGNSQMGWDATARTLSNLALQIRMKVDQGMLYMGLAAALAVANNIAATWTIGTTQDDLAALVADIGLAKLKIANRYYNPTFIVCSYTNAERLSNWLGFAALNKLPGNELGANGMLGTVKGLPVIQTTQFPDEYILVGNQQLVAHRIYQAMVFKGPYPTFDSNGKIIAADQYYTEEFNGTDTPVFEKGSLVKVA